MHIYAAPRCGGKTHALLQLMYEHVDAVLIEPNHSMARYVLGQHPELAGRILPPSRERLRGTLGRVYVDNADYILSELLGRDVSAATVTGTATCIMNYPACLRVSEGL